MRYGGVRFNAMRDNRLPLYLAGDEKLLMAIPEGKNELERCYDQLSQEGQDRLVQFARRLIAQQSSHSMPVMTVAINVEGSDLTVDRVVEVGATLPKKTTIVAFFEPDNSFFDYFVRLLSEYAERRDIRLVSNLVSRAEAGAPSARHIAASDSRYLFFTFAFAPMARRYLAAGNRVVLIGAPQYRDLVDIPNVHTDHAQGGFIAARHLIDLGHRNIAYVNVSADFNQSPRWIGFQSALSLERDADAQLTAEFLSLDTVRSWGRFPELARAYFSASNAPTALMAWNDHDAVEILGVLTAAAIRVPEDVSLIGYDGLPEGEEARPALTTVDSGIRRQIESALLILTQETPPAPETQIVVPTSLLIRKSTAPPRLK
ncbi:MAG TPA: LacI family DNA-binding transcriptional regulator [Capsulimonadaceae bacterium]